MNTSNVCLDDIIKSFRCRSLGSRVSTTFSHCAIITLKLLYLNACGKPLSNILTSRACRRSLWKAPLPKCPEGRGFQSCSSTAAACGCEQLLVPQRRDGTVWSVPPAWWMLTFHLLTQQLFLTHPCVPCDLTDKHRAGFVSSVGSKLPGMWRNFYIKPYCIWVIFAGQKPPAVWLYCGCTVVLSTVPV